MGWLYIAATLLSTTQAKISKSSNSDIFEEIRPYQMGDNYTSKKYWIRTGMVWGIRKNRWQLGVTKDNAKMSLTKLKRYTNCKVEECETIKNLA